MTAFAASTTSELRPLSAGELLDRAFRLYRRQFLTFIGIVAIVQIPVSLLQMGSNLFSTTSTLGAMGDSSGGQATFALLLSYVVAIVGGLLIQALPIGALSKAVAGSYLDQPLGLIESYRKVGRLWIRILLAMILAIVVGIGLGLWALIPCIGWLTGVGILLFFELIVVGLVPVVIVLEGQSASASLRRAWDLTRQRFWPVVGFVTLLSLLSLLFTIGPGLLLGMLIGVTASSSDILGSGFAVTQVVVSALAGLLVNLIWLPLKLAAMVLLYFDLRVRTEGLDLAVLARDETDTTGDVSTVLEQAPQVRTTQLVTWRELGYFAGISVVLLGLYAGLVVGLGMLMAGFGGL